MFNLVCPDLISTHSVQYTPKDGHDPFMIDEYFPTPEIMINPEKHPNHKIFPVARVLKYDEDGKLKVHSFRDPNGRSKVRLTLTNNNIVYDSTAFLIAIPFCGIMSPIAKNSYLRIHTATIMRSDAGATVHWMDQNYTSVAYLLVSLDQKAMRMDEVTEIKMTFTSYHTRRIGDDRKHYRSQIVLVLKDDGTYDIDRRETEEFTPGDPGFNPPTKDAPFQKAFPLYEVPERKDKFQNYQSACPDDAEFVSSRKRGKKNRNNA